MKGKLSSWFKSLGPGIIIAALVFGPSKITITSILGAEYGYSLLWIVVLASFFMIVFTNISARIGLATDKSLLASISMKWGKWAGIVIGIGIFLVASSFQAGNSVGIGIALSEPTGISQLVWILIFNIIVIALLFFKNFYGILEKLMTVLIVLMLAAFITTLFFARPSVEDVLSGLTSFSFPMGSTGIVIAYFASAFSIVGAAYQSYLVQERKKNFPEIKQTGREGVPGLVILGLMSAMLLITAAVVLNPQEIRISSASDMAKALEPAFGKYASYIFMAGLFGASFSSLVGNATLGGTLFGDALGYGNKLESWSVRLMIALVVGIGMIVAIAFGKLPIQLIVLAQAVTIFIVPFIGIAVYLVACDEKIMGGFKMKGFGKIAGAIGIFLLIFLAINNGYVLFFK